MHIGRRAESIYSSTLEIPPARGMNLNSMPHRRCSCRCICGAPFFGVLTEDAGHQNTQAWLRAYNRVGAIKRITVVYKLHARHKKHTYADWRGLAEGQMCHEGGQ